MGSFIDYLLGLKPGDFTFAMVKPDGCHHTHDILEMIRSAGFQVHAHPVLLTDTQVRALYYSHLRRPYYEKNAAHNMSGAVTVAVIEGPDALNWWRNTAMPDIRTKWGSNDPENRPANVVHGSDSPEAAFREAHYFFG
jgi:nucleoside-diphosphate kinase